VKGLREGGDRGGEGQGKRGLRSWAEGNEGEDGKPGGGVSRRMDWEGGEDTGRGDEGWGRARGKWGWRLAFTFGKPEPSYCCAASGVVEGGCVGCG